MFATARAPQPQFCRCLLCLCLLLAALLIPAEAASWPKADRWISWWFMPYVQNVSAVQSQALVSTVREHRDAFDSLIVYCGHNLGTDGSLTVDQPLLDFCNATLLGPLRELGALNDDHRNLRRQHVLVRLPPM